MKYPFLTLCAIALSCSASEPHPEHINSSEIDHSAEHTHADGSVHKGEHVHADGTVHKGEHVHADGSVHKGEHVHADGSVHKGEHVHADGSVHKGEHVHADGTVHKGEHVHADGTVHKGEHVHADGTVHRTAEPEEDHSNCSGGHDHGESADSGVVIVQADAHSRHILNMQVEEVPAASHVLTNSLYGYLTMPEHAMVTYALPCAGRISLRVKSAQQVHKGDVLYTVESPAVSDQIAELQKTEANLERCSAELAAMEARVARLQGVGTRNSDLEEQLKFKKAELGQLTREQATSRARLRMLAMGAELVEDQDGIYTLLVKAEKDGTVRNVGISQGSWGEQGTAVITMSDTDAMEIEATLYGADVPRISEVRAIIPIGRENVALKGTWRLAEQVDAEKQTRAIYFTPDSLPAGAVAGKLCRLDLYDAPAHANTVSIPDSAVVKVGVDDVVFVEVAEGQFAMVKVRAGESRRGMTPVSGLTPGQKIVVKGGYELKYILPGEGQKKKAGHFHADGKFHEGEDH